MSLRNLVLIGATSLTFTACATIAGSTNMLTDDKISRIHLAHWDMRQTT